MERRHKLATWGGTGLAGIIALVFAAFNVAGFDWAAWGLDTSKLLIPAIGIPVMFYLRYFANNKIPKPLLPWVGVGIATGGDYIAAYLTGTPTLNPILRVALFGIMDGCYTFAKELVGDSA